ncbi:efflux RND transporter periplasmic adaptor subunit [Pseudoteredinibacter isoporae]|uniref:RND family efflux transporter MFP subunit n=1 Tax=Pseudoteredinibacter isoporae TaxID=570281 RepID=A0A7X0JWP0_9GAMM|nr:efflux RND transporter periplasmic adaptor subunit [Pseudoteredinibacter isoporae]MBB6522666.1 RND family efflux transporter MFP subunit [Pseudoteredinibacter isoporae]NHO88197.1 efflux RND transporter periplasmic adaptor subunit [Pseudoteredinibacter isoporae]NIB23472.1 efflux RND transporter periplasmic adaptor subunit [Pseudoteredinibacter isoporae]
MKKSVSKTGGPLLAALVLFVVSISYTSYAIDNKPEPEQQSLDKQLAQVTVQSLSLETHQAYVYAHAEVRSRYELQLSSELSGRVQSLNTAFESGRILPAQTVLLDIDPLRYQQELAQAEQDLAQATLDLMLEQQEAKQARLEWQESGLQGQADDLRLRKPQLQLAKAKLAQTQARLKLAKQNVARTKIDLPFTAVVVERLVAPGQYVQAGEAIATIHSAEELELKVMLNPSQWALLADQTPTLVQKNILLRDKQGGQWTAKIARMEQRLDRETRLRSLVLEVVPSDKNQEPLLPGNFVTAEIPGRQEEQLLAVPASSLSSLGELWYVDKEQRLRHFKADISFQYDGKVYVRPPESIASKISNASLDFLTTPLPGYVGGQKVMPQKAKDQNAISDQLASNGLGS